VHGFRGWLEQRTDRNTGLSGPTPQLSRGVTVVLVLLLSLGLWGVFWAALSTFAYEALP
jgi:hypothetical protein